MRTRRVAMLLIPVMVLAACSSSDSTSSPDPTTAPANGLVVDTPDPSGPIDKIVWALDYEPSSLDWAYAYNYAENTVLSSVCENLLRLAPDYSIQPALAESFSHPSPTTWVYEIREGVTFHDGKPMTIDDVVWSLNRHLDADVGSYWGGWMANVASITATGPMQVTVELTKPDVVFNQMMATPAGAVAEQAFVEAAGADYGTPDGGVMCTGPYKLESWSGGSSLTLAAYEGYWDANLQPKAAVVEMPFITEESTLISAMLTGEIDGTFSVPPSGAAQLASSDAGTLYFGPSMQSFNVIVSSFDGALGDARIRRALTLALDREGIVAAAVDGNATVLKGVVAPPSWGYSADVFQAGWDALPGIEQDLDAAKALVAEAGVPDEPIVLATLGESEELGIISTALQDAARQLGIELEISVLPVGTYATLFFDAEARVGIDMFLTGWYTDVPEPLNMYATIFTTDGASNYNGYSNEEYDRLISEALGTDDPDARAALVVQAQAIILEEAPWIPLYTPNVRVFQSKRVSGVPTTFVYLYYPWLAEIGAA